MRWQLGCYFSYLLTYLLTLNVKTVRKFVWICTKIVLPWLSAPWKCKMLHRNITFKACRVDTSLITVPHTPHDPPPLHTHTRTLCNQRLIRAESTLSPQTLVLFLLPLPLPLYTPIGMQRWRLHTSVGCLACEQTCSRMPDWHLWNNSTVILAVVVAAAVVFVVITSSDGIFGLDLLAAWAKVVQADK